MVGLARLNKVMVYGTVTHMRIARDAAGVMAYGEIIIETYRRCYGGSPKKKDTELVRAYTRDKSLLRIMDRDIRTLDTVIVKGTLSTEWRQKEISCPDCGQRTEVTETYVFLAPISISREGRHDSWEDARREVMDHIAMSNDLTILGTLAADPVRGYKSAQYQLCSNRSYRIAESPDRTDLPWVRSYRGNAKADLLTLQKNSDILADGYIQDRKLSPDVKCRRCGKALRYEPQTIEAVTYDVRHLWGCRPLTEEGAEKLSRQKWISYIGGYLDKVYLYGVVERTTVTGNAGILILRTYGSKRSTGGMNRAGDTEVVRIMTSDPVMMEKIRTLDPLTVVYVKGRARSKTLKKAGRCPDCGQASAGKIAVSYISPDAICVQEKYEERQEAEACVRRHAEISDGIIICGTVTRPPKMIVNDMGIPLSQYRISSGGEEMWVKSFGDKAYTDRAMLTEGAVVVIDGYLRSRPLRKTVTCPVCGQRMDLFDRTMEIVAYSTEYTEGAPVGYTVPGGHAFGIPGGHAFGIPGGHAVRPDGVTDQDLDEGFDMSSEGVLP